MILIRCRQMKADAADINYLFASAEIRVHQTFPGGR